MEFLQKELNSKIVLPWSDELLSDPIVEKKFNNTIPPPQKHSGKKDEKGTNSQLNSGDMISQIGGGQPFLKISASSKDAQIGFVRG